MLFLETDKAAAIGLHDEVAMVGLAVLELMGYLLLEVEDVVEAFLLQIPDVKDAGMLLRS